MRSPDGWEKLIKEFGKFCEELNPDLIVGIESRGFLIGASLSTAQGIGFVPVRKSGKLPGETLGIDYSLEYGTDRLEVQADAFSTKPRVVIVDDLLATGGTACASTKLVKKAGGNVVGLGFAIELEGLGGRANLPNKIPIKSLIAYS